MPAAPFPPDELDRLAALRALDIVDEPAADLFDSFIRVALSLFDVPIAAISLVDSDRQWFMASAGLEMRETPRSASFCAHAILSAAELLQVPDATADDRFSDSPLVTGPLSLRFYAGAPLIDAGGHALGTLCIIDRAPRRLRTEQLARLADLARGVSAALELHGVAKRLERESKQDPLTSLGNRREFEATLERLGGAELTLFLLDLDRFKSINDLFGHAGGDAALREVASRLREATAGCCQAFRLGGDEFALVAPRFMLSQDRATLARRVHDALADTFVLAGSVVPMQASIGAAGIPGDADTAREVLRVADIALYHAKASGRGEAQDFSPDMPIFGGRTVAPTVLRQGAIGRIDLGNRLRRALVPEGQEPFTLVFQPIVDLRTGDTSCIEALVRWDVGPGEPVSPGVFVPMAERLGLVSHLDRWVLGAACRAAVAWPEPWAVSVNISAASFGVIDVAAMVKQALERSGLPASRLVIEMTETALVEDQRRARDAVKTLRALGVGVALDDFGAGHGTLRALREFPFSKIKVDKALIAEIETDAMQAHLVTLVGQLGQLLDVDVVVEGVETEEALRSLTALGAGLAQGRLLSWPVPDGEVGLAVAVARRAVRATLGLDGLSVSDGAVPA